MVFYNNSSYILVAFLYCSSMFILSRFNSRLLYKFYIDVILNIGLYTVSITYLKFMKLLFHVIEFKLIYIVAIL